jgi:hypothetical protein
MRDRRLKRSLRSQAPIPLLAFRSAQRRLARSARRRTVPAPMRSGYNG